MKNTLYFWSLGSGVCISDTMPSFAPTGQMIVNKPNAVGALGIHKEVLKLFGIPRLPKDRVIKAEIEVSDPLMSTVERQVVATGFVPMNSEEQIKEQKKGGTSVLDPDDDNSIDADDWGDEDLDEEEDKG